ncbi:hypothetical protein QQX09_02375 [Demequina sp. SYSU T00192]|uniref:Uncharacterized protein n=1 Tax=Demequina litoralis TaxID=3051660 RepID=A0ABT8G6C8_9MICO|nr:hypothetical protein [Demequina sp. SYSU T00192]MDN4474695.1 hypothetical protein [Demequina sp. SYSU T00192]
MVGIHGLRTRPIAAAATCAAAALMLAGVAAAPAAGAPGKQETGAPFAVQGSGLSITNGGSSVVTLKAQGDARWAIPSGTDVTTWIVNADGSPAFTDADGVATAKVSGDGRTLTLKVTGAEIDGFTANGSGTLGVVPPAGAMTVGGGGYEPVQVEVGGFTLPAISVDSSLFGSAFTHSKSTLKEHLDGVVEYGSDSSATIALDLDGLKAGKIDTSGATIALVDGDGYFPSEYTFGATELGTDWVDGELAYTLDQGDLMIDTGDYLITDTDSGREWSCLGGDGSGRYTFNLEVSGITYNGLPVASQTFPLHVYIYGQDYSGPDAEAAGAGTPVEAVLAPLADKVDDAPAPSAAPVWTWVGAGDQPVLVDHEADDFYVTWPEGVVASALTAEDVTLTMRSAYGDEKTLEPGVDYVVDASAGETQIAVTYVNWAFVPVYSSMSIAVDPTALEGEVPDAADLVADYDIASVYAYEAQQGGGGTRVDGTVVAYSFYGLANLTEASQIIADVTYTLGATVDGTAVYYAEDAAGTPFLTADPAEAAVLDGNGVADRNVQLIGNSVYITNRSDQTVDLVVEGETVTFTKAYAGGGLKNPTTADPGLTALPGYVIPWGTTNWITHEKWSWMESLRDTEASGWRGLEPVPHGARFTQPVERGATQQFTVTDPDVTWGIVGASSPGTTVSADGVLTVAWNEASTYFAVYARSTTDDSISGIGSVSISVRASTAAVDKAALQDAIDEAAGVDPGAYTASSYAAFTAAYDAAVAVLGGAGATDADVEGAIEALAVATAGLVVA